jgi:archaemetzincin
MKRNPASRSPSHTSDTLFSQHDRRIILSPIGEFDHSILEPVTQKIDQAFGFQVERKPLLQDVQFALDTDRNQYHSTSILEKLSGSAPSHAIKVLGITRVDLFIPILTYVYGEAQLGGNACIISTHRLDERSSSIGKDPPLYERAAKEAIHELGHTFKLRHCRDEACIMHYCRSVEDVDRKTDQFCRYCRTLLNDEIKRLAKK